MLGAMYLALLPLVSYLSGNKDSWVALTSYCLIILFDLIVTDYLGLTLDNFFLCSAIATCAAILLSTTCKIPLNTIKKYLVSIFTFTSLLLNIYLCFELGNVWVYREWETINLLLCELIFITLIIPDRRLEMLSNVKTYIYGAIGAVILFLVGLVKYLSSKNKSLEKELKTEKHNAAVKEEVRQVEKSIQKNIEEVRKDSEVIHEQNKKDAINHKRPSGSFNDPRL